MSNTIFIQYYISPLGILIAGDFNGKLCLLDWQYRTKRQQIDERVCKFFNATYSEKNTPLLSLVIQQLDEYFLQKRKTFDIPLVFAGSAFQQKVWDELMHIPYGKTISYIQLSQQLGNKQAIRAVASANGANAISIMVPCHRVIGSNGELTGYAGGLAAKKKLLKLENAITVNELF